MKILITSRTEPEILSFMRSWKPITFLLNQRNRQDLHSFIHEVVGKYGRDNSFDEEIIHRIASDLNTRADGMFLWARLAWNQFTDGVGVWTRATLLERLDNLEQLPPGLDALYHRILDTIDPRFHSDLIKVFHWIVLSRRPLSVDELSVALAIKETLTQIKDLDISLNTKQFLKQICPHLVNIGPAGITVVHLSFTNFLLKSPEVSVDNQRIRNKFYLARHDCDYEIGLKCLRYLNVEDFITLGATIGNIGWLDIPRWDIADGELQRFPFLDYAARYWPAHVKQSDFAEDVFSAFYKITKSRLKFKVMCAGYGSSPGYQPPIFLAQAMNLHGIVRRLVQDGHDINERDGAGVHVLHHAGPFWKRGSPYWMHGRPDWDLLTNEQLVNEVRSIEFLTEMGADLSSRARGGLNYLMFAFMDEHFDLVRSLLALPGNDINAQDDQGSTILHHAILGDSRRFREIIDMLSSYGQLDKNLVDVDDHTPLMKALYWGRKAMAETLLEDPQIDTGDASIHGRTPLIYAACHGWPDVVVSLVQKSSFAVIDGGCDSTQRTILHWTAKTGMLSALELALSKQMTILDSPDSRGMTALHYAAKQKNLVEKEADFTAVSLLLHKGAEACTMNRCRETPLHFAALRGHKQMVQKLLEYMPSGALNQIDYLHCTAVHKAAISSNEELITYLVDRDDIVWERRDKHGRTALFYAAAFATRTILEKILQRITPDFDEFSYTLLHMAVAGNNADTVRYLLDHPHLFFDDVNRRTCWGRTALDLAPHTLGLTLSLELEAAGLRHSVKCQDEVEASISTQSVPPPDPEPPQPDPDWPVVLHPTEDNAHKESRNLAEYHQGMIY